MPAMEMAFLWVSAATSLATALATGALVVTAVRTLSGAVSSFGWCRNRTGPTSLRMSCQVYTGLVLGIWRLRTPGDQWRTR